MTKLGGLFLGASLMTQCIYKVDPGQRAIIFDKFGGGIETKVRAEGYHFFIPFKQEVIKYDVRILTYDHPTDTGTKDLQKVNLKIRLFYRPIEEFLPKIHLELNRDYMKKTLPALGNEVSKVVIARYDAEHLLKNREKVANEIKEELMKRAKFFNLILEDVSIWDIKFSPEFMNSIE